VNHLFFAMSGLSFQDFVCCSSCIRNFGSLLIPHLQGLLKKLKRAKLSLKISQIIMISLIQATTHSLSSLISAKLFKSHI